MTSVINLKEEKGPVILTEGVTDCHVMLAICKKYELKKNFGFYSCDSDNQCLTRLKLLLYGSDCPDKLAIVIDADNPNLQSRWESIKEIIKPYIKQIPDLPDPKGSILHLDQEINVRLGIWLMPNNTINGMLEDFCIGIAPEQSIKLAEEYIDNCIEQSVAEFISNHRSKAILYSFLAVQSDPGTQIGLSITKNSLKNDHPSVKLFADWMKKVFD